CSDLFLSLLRPPPLSPLFPYTTLFRSNALMLRIALAFLIVTTSLLPAAEQRRDTKAEEIAHSVMNAMGGEKAWYGAHFVRYDFRSEEHTSELQSRRDLVCRLLLEKKKK